jgi:GNAT superfamily N-acetyltransferase
LPPDDIDQDLNDFIQHDAARHFDDRIAVTYTLENAKNADVCLAFATLQNDAIVVENSSDLPGIAGEYPYKTYPAVKIGRLGVSLKYQRNRIGSLFLYMLKELMLDANRTGCRFITVDARRDKRNSVDTRPFYQENGFSELPCRPKTSTYVPMFFDLKALVL